MAARMGAAARLVGGMPTDRGRIRLKSVVLHARLRELVLQRNEPVTLLLPGKVVLVKIEELSAERRS